MNQIASQAIAVTMIAVPAIFASPTLIAVGRGMVDRKRIMTLNIVGVVFFSCFLAALAWSLTGRRDVSFYDRVMANKIKYLVPAVAALAFLTIMLALLGMKFLPVAPLARA